MGGYVGLIKKLILPLIFLVSGIITALVATINLILNDSLKQFTITAIIAMILLYIAYELLGRINVTKGI